MDSKVTDMSAMFTSHHALATCAVTMKSDKLSQTNMVPKHVSANVLMVSRTLPMVALQWDHATTTTAILKQLASQLELHTAKDSHANVMMDSSVMVLTSVLPQIHVQTVTPTHHAKPCLATVVKMSRNVFVKPHTLVMVFPAEEVPHAIPTVQEDQSAGMDNVDAPTMVSGTTIKHTNAKTRTNARKLTRTIAPKMQLAEIPMEVSSAHVMLDSRVMVSHASLPTDLVHTLIHQIHTLLPKPPSTCLTRVISLVELVLIYPFSLNLTKENALSWVTTGLPSNYWHLKCNGSNNIKNKHR
jgi:hypothetical protein